MDKGNKLSVNLNDLNSIKNKNRDIKKRFITFLVDKMINTIFKQQSDSLITLPDISQKLVQNFSSLLTEDIFTDKNWKYFFFPLLKPHQVEDSFSIKVRFN
jgi:hypothetical protein